MDNIRNTIETKKGIPSDPAQRGEVNFMPSKIKPNRIDEIAAKVGGGKLSGGAKKFGAFMQEMKDKDITVRDVIKSYGITQSSIMRGDKEVNTVKKRWPDAPFKDGARVRPEDAFAALLGTAEGKKYLDAAEQGTFDLQSAKNMIKKFTTFGLQNKLLVSLKDAAEKFYPKAGEIISAVRSMPTGEYADYVRQNFPGISYGKVGFMSGHLGRGDLPTFDSRQKQLVYGKDVNITKERLLEQRDRLLKLGINVPEKYKEFAQTLLHHEVWDRLNKSDTEHGEIKNAMLNFMPAAPDTPAFKKWFGDSKVLDDQGKPLVIYHGAQQFEGSVFKPSKAVNRRGNPSGYYFTEDPSEASLYAEKDRGGDNIEYGNGALIIPAYLNIKNPYNLDRTIPVNAGMLRQYKIELLKENNRFDENSDWIISKLKFAKENNVILSQSINGNGDAFTRIIKAGGYDGVKDGRHWVAFDPTQIKSAIANKGTFDQNNPDIRFMPAMQFSAPENLPKGKVWRGENGYAIIQKEGGKFRVHSPIGLIGIASSYEAAEKMASKRNNK